jgi:glycerophosphoryl diester phosphodiesterase
LQRKPGTSPLVIGHRGCCKFAPENTLPSISYALRAGADLVELDYRHSRDDLPVVIHDPHLDRTTNSASKWARRRIEVASKTAEEIGALDAGSWFGPQFNGARVPLLSEALDLISARSIALIERKAGDAARCVELLRGKNLIHRAVVQSFDWRFLRELHQLEPSLTLGALGPPNRLAGGRKPAGLLRGLNVLWLREAVKTGARVVVWNRRTSRLAVRQAHHRGLSVWVYTIDDPRQANRLRAAGVDGIITNDVPLIKRAVSEQQGKSDSGNLTRVAHAA